MIRLCLLALVATTTLARAEDPIVASPLPPPDATTQAPAPAAPAPAQPPTPAPAAAIPWLPKDTAVLQALDKVNSRSTLLTVKVGQSATFGSLTIAVKACDIRPPDAPADATAFLTITDKNPKAPGFTGWMLKATPSVSMLEHPIYDIRVVGCT